MHLGMCVLLLLPTDQQQNGSAPLRGRGVCSSTTSVASLCRTGGVSLGLQTDTRAA
jgi:hypothetical protein